MTLPRPQFEKRMLPLLDVTLSLVGILILMVGLSNQSPGEGQQGEVCYLTVQRSGEIVFGSTVVASPAGQMHEQAMAALVQKLQESPRPLVLIQYPRPDNTASDVSAELVRTVSQHLSQRGYQVRIVIMQREGERP